MVGDEKFSGAGRRPHRAPDRRRQPGQSLCEEIMELDADLLALLTRRSALVSKLRKGKAHASTPGIIKSEKQIRSAWERQTSRLSSSTRLSRQLFGLINELKIQPERDGEDHIPFNLSPSRLPADVDVAGPRSTVISQLWLSLAAAGGRPTSLLNAPRSAPMLDTVRAFEQTGVHVEWQGENLILDGKNMPDYQGKAIFLGDDILTFYVFVFLGVARPGKLRFTGGPGLKEADFSALARFLPGLGARLVQVVPGTKGLPANLECSGELPEELVIPAELPVEAVLALMMSALTWKHKISISLAEQSPLRQFYIIDLAKRAFQILPSLGQALEKSIEFKGYAVSDLDFPAKIKPPLDPVVAAGMLALPIFSGGSVKLSGKWLNMYQAGELIALLKIFGLKIMVDNMGVSSALLPDSVWPESLELAELTPPLHPLFWVLNARLAGRAKGRILIRRWPDGADLELAEDFMAQVGYKLERAPDGLLVSPMDPGEFKSVASKTYGWPCPTFCWGLAMSLAAFMRSNLKISNPDCVSRMQPDYWHLYNRLPSPKIRSVANPADDAPRQAARRRIRTDSVAEPLPREDSGDGD